MIRSNKSEQKGDICCLVNEPTATGSLSIYIDVFTQSLRYQSLCELEAGRISLFKSLIRHISRTISAPRAAASFVVVVVVVVTALNGCRFFASDHKRAFTENKYTSDVRLFCLFLFRFLFAWFFIFVFVIAFNSCSLFARDHKRAVAICHTYLQVAFCLLWPHINCKTADAIYFLSLSPWAFSGSFWLRSVWRPRRIGNGLIKNDSRFLQVKDHQWIAIVSRVASCPCVCYSDT